MEMETGRKITKRYTAIIKRHTRKTIIDGFVSPNRFNSAITEMKQHIAWAHLFETETGTPVVSFFCENEAVKLGIIKDNQPAVEVA